MANDLAVYDRVQNPMEFVEKMGTSMAQSGMFGCKNLQQGMVLAMACLTEKKNPIELARTYHIIDGKLSMRADAMLAEFRIRGGKVEWLNIGDDGKESRARFTFDGQTLEIAFTIDEAKRMQLVKPNSNWVKNPGAMLRARCVSKAVRIVAPEIVAGVYAPEELGDGEGVRGANGEVIEGEFCWPNASTPAKAAEKEAAPKVDAKELIRQKAAERAAAAASTQANGSEQHGSTPGENGESVAEAAASEEDQSNGIQADSSSEPPFDASDSGTPEPNSATGPADGPCTPVQVDQIKSMLRDIEKTDAKIGDKIKKALAAQGFSKISELSRSGAEELLRKLYQKAAGERLSQPAKAAETAGANSPN